MKPGYLVLLPCFALLGCTSSPPLEDEGSIGLYRAHEEVIVERQSTEIICVTEQGQRTCVPVVHQESGDES